MTIKLKLFISTIISGAILLIMCFFAIKNDKQHEIPEDVIKIDTIYLKKVYPTISTNFIWKSAIKDSIDIYQRYKIEYIGEVEATIYHAVEGQTNNQPLITASRLKINHTDNAYSHRYLAVSQDFIKSGKLSYGNLVLLDNISIPEYNGIWIVADCMNNRFTNKIDLLVNPGMKGDYWRGDRKITICKLSF